MRRAWASGGARASLVVSVGLSLLLPACAARHPPSPAGTSPPPPMRDEPEPPPPLRLRLSDDADEIDAELLRAESELQSLQSARDFDSDDSAPMVAESEDGAPVTNSAPVRPTSAPSSAPSRCDRIQNLASEICQLRDHVCRLATEHEDQPRYVDACERAGQTCEQAEQAAQGCS